MDVNRAGVSDSSFRRIATRQWAALAVVCVATLVIVMDGSIVNVALPTLAERLPGVTNSGLQWIVDAYILVFAATLLTAGSAADRLGRRVVLIAGLLTFGATSTGASLARSSEALITWRAAMGLGAALIFPSTLAVITEEFRGSRHQRLAIALWAGVSGLGVAIGPVAGGWLLKHFHWGSIFLVNIPIIVITLFGAALCIRESRDTSRRRIDPLGNALAILAVLTLVWALIESPQRGWISPFCLGALGSAGALLAMFIFVERRSSSPMLDVAFFRDPTLAIACAAITIAFFGLFGFVFMVTQYFQFVHGYDALATGLRTAPFAGFILIGAIAAARFEGDLGRRALISAGLILMACGFAWTTVDTVETSYSVMALQMGALGVGLGLVNAAATAAIMSAIPPARAGSGSSINDTVREIGGTLGVACMGSLFNTVYRAEIVSRLGDASLPVEAKAAAQSSVAAAYAVIEQVALVAGDSAASRLRVPIEHAFLDGFHASSWIASAATLAGAVVVAVRMPGRTAKFSDVVADRAPCS